MTLLQQHLDEIAGAPDTVSLERAAQRAWTEFPSGRSGHRVDRAVATRGRELCAASPHAHLIPILGTRRKLMLGGYTYRVGYGGNGAGERYAWHFAEQWIAGRLAAAGLKPAVVRGVLGWWLSFPHRALASIEMGGWRTSFGRKGGRPKRSGT